MWERGSTSSSSLGILNSSIKIFSPVEVKKATPAVGDPSFFSSRTALVNEVGDSFDWISNLKFQEFYGWEYELEMEVYLFLFLVE